MLRHVIRREVQAAIELKKKTAGDRSQSVFCVQNCPFSSASYFISTSRTAFSRSQAFPILKIATRSSVVIATPTTKLFWWLKITIKNAEIITALKTPEPKNDISHSFDA